MFGKALLRTALHGLVLAGVFTVGSLVGPYLWHLGTADAQAGPPRGIAADAPAANPAQPAFSQTLRAKTFEVVDDTLALNETYLAKHKT